MVRKKPGNNKFLKQLNQTDILNLIRSQKSISRAELSEQSGLTPTAIGVIVSNLLEAGHILETGTGKSKGGRKPVMLQINSQSRFSIGVDMDVDYIRFVLMNVAGETVAEKTVVIYGQADLEKIVGIIVDNTKGLLKEHSLSKEKILGIGISVPGIIDQASGDIILAPNLGWRNADIRTPLVEATGIPVFVENESMASAIGENWVGACQGCDDFVCINIKSGIGSGIFIRGKPYRGVGGTAGEFGHVSVDENGIKCGCGNYGCLETVASADRIVEKAKKLARQGTLTGLDKDANIDDINIGMISEAARKGDEAARSILLEASMYLGIAISNIINILNPEKIVLGKEFVKFSDIALSYIRKVAESRSLEQAASEVQILESSLGDKASVLGAAIIPVKSFFGQ